MNPLGDNGIFDDPSSGYGPNQHSNTHAFVTSFGAALIGAAVGSSLDDTRFGRWVNTSALIGCVGGLLKTIVISLFGYYVYCVIKVW